MTGQGRVELRLRPIEHEKVLDVKESGDTWFLTPNGRHLVDEAKKLFFEPLPSRYPSWRRQLRTSVREWICGDREFDGGAAMANKALRQTVGCAGRN